MAPSISSAENSFSSVETTIYIFLKVFSSGKQAGTNIFFKKGVMYELRGLFI